MIFADHLPHEIINTDRALLWRKEARDDKPTKVPYQPARPGTKADVTDPATWGSFTTALDAYRDGKADGVGFVLGDGITGVDLDKCRDAETGVINPVALQIIRDLDSYTEISPSGTGVHILLTGVLPPGRRRKGTIEMYSDGRYFTLTGEHLEGTPTVIEERTNELAALHARTFSANGKSEQPDLLVNARVLELDDTALLERARNAANGSKFAALWAGDTSGHDSPSEADLALCSLLVFWTDQDASRMDWLFRQSGLMRAKWDKLRGEETYGAITIGTAVKGCRDTFSHRANGRPKTPDPSSKKSGEDRLKIEIREELNAVTDEAVSALFAHPELGVYVRSRMLVTVAGDGSRRERWLRRPPGAQTIVPIEAARMLGMLDDAASWEKWSQRAGSLVKKRPPEWVATQILSRLEWPFPYLDAVVEAPTLRPDGSVISIPGWDESTGLLFQPVSGQSWPTVLHAPTRTDVERATQALVDPVQGFPFVADSDRAAYVACVLSILGRHLIEGPVPAFPIRAPTPGTGKTLLAEVTGIIGTGRVPSAMSMTNQTEELRKRIMSLAVDGTPLVLLENISGSLGSDVLAAALTATEWKDRILGRTEMVSAPLRAVWIMTGNNLGFKRTLGRRVVPIDLDAKVETPEDRTDFRYADLRAHVGRHRPELVTAALTLLRAFHLAGRPPHGDTRMGSYEAWDDLVRSAVIWAGMADPATTKEGHGRGRIRSQADDDLEGLGALLEALQRLYPDRVPFSTASAIKKAKDDDTLSGVLDAVAAPPKGGHTTARSLGATLRETKDRPIGGLVLRRQKRTWTVESTGD